MHYKLPLVLTLQPGGLHGDVATIAGAGLRERFVANIEDALVAVIEAYQDLGRSLPQ